MVSHRRPSPRSRGAARPRAGAAPATRDRLVTAAAAEFAARGFEGAKVDRIAARAAINKAMVYYHFHDKAALYRHILLDVFRHVAGAVADVRAAGGTPETQLSAYIQAVADQAIARPHFPPIWLRELAEGGRHLDESTVTQMRRVLETLAAILRDGREQGVFGETNPLMVQMGIVAPLLLFAATAPARERFRRFIPQHLSDLTPAAAVVYVRATTLAAVAAQPPAAARSAARRRPS